MSSGTPVVALVFFIFSVISRAAASHSFESLLESIELIIGVRSSNSLAKAGCDVAIRCWYLFDCSVKWAATARHNLGSVVSAVLAGLMSYAPSF